MYKKTMVTILLLLLVSMLFTLPASAAEPKQNISPSQYEQMVKDTLAAMKTAYEQKDLRAFMHLVSPDFTGDDFMMYRAVRRDFRFFDDIRLYLYVGSFSVDAKGRAQVAVKYNRSVIANKDGRSYRDSGLTQLTFHVENSQAKLYEMKFPIIFGLSEGLQMATGIVRTAETANVMVVDRRGNVYVKPFKDALDAANGASVVRGMVHLSSTPGFIQSFSLEDNMKVPMPGSTLQGDFGWDDTGQPFLLFQNSAKYVVLPNWSFDSTTQAPDPATTPYITWARGDRVISAGMTLALQLPGSNKFAIIEVQSVSATPSGTSGTIRYKYQPSGSRYF